MADRVDAAVYGAEPSESHSVLDRPIAQAKLWSCARLTTPCWRSASAPIARSCGLGRALPLHYNGKLRWSGVSPPAQRGPG